MNLTIRPVTSSDIEACAGVAFDAHQTVAAAHNFPPEQPSLDFSTAMMNGKLQDPMAHGLVAESDGRIVGSIFLNCFLPEIAAIGPLTVHPSAEGGTGGRLMEAALEEARQRQFKGVRLVQSPYHLRSLALYAKSGFAAREPLVLIGGSLPREAIPGRVVRPATAADVPACSEICEHVHGIRRELELNRGIEKHAAYVVEREGRLAGYASGLGLLGHAVADTTDDLKALIVAAPAVLGPGFFVPIRNGALFSWLLRHDLRCLWPATLMTLGWYQEPQGAFLPAISF